MGNISKPFVREILDLGGAINLIYVNGASRVISKLHITMVEQMYPDKPLLLHLRVLGNRDFNNLHAIKTDILTNPVVANAAELAGIIGTWLGNVPTTVAGGSTPTWTVSSGNEYIIDSRVGDAKVGVIAAGMWEVDINNVGLQPITFTHGGKSYTLEVGAWQHFLAKKNDAAMVVDYVGEVGYDATNSDIRITVKM